MKDHEAKASDSKDVVIGGRYKNSACIAQLKAVLEAFAASGIEVPADAEPTAAAGNDAGADANAAAEGKKEGEGEGEANEGGDAEQQYEGGNDAPPEGGDKPEGGEAPAALPAMAPESPEKYDADDYAYGGWETVPAIFLKQAIVNPYWGDLVKGNIISWEFTPKKHTDSTWNAAAGYISSFIATSARTDQEAFFSGYLGDDDLASLKGIAKDGPILFPGWIQGWKTKEEAAAYIANINVEDNKAHLNKVIFHVSNASTLGFASCRLVAHRLQGKVQENKDEDGTTLFTVTGEPHND